jgi:YidC/Oxa1 family membrane protein insertase
MPDNSTRSMIIFVISAAIILGLYQFLVLAPAQKQAAAQQKAQAAAVQPLPTAPGAAPAAAVRLTRAEALAQSPRVPINTPSLSGSISLRGGRFDDLSLRRYKTTLDDPAPVEWLKPKGVEYAQFAELGWTGQNLGALPNGDTVWTLASGASLTPATPVTLTYNNGTGLNFTRTISVDENYLFTIKDTVANAGAAAATIAPYGSVQRQNLPPEIGKNAIVQEGAIGVLGPAGKLELRQVKYPKWKKEKKQQDFDSRGGWLGLTDKYWLAALVPGQGEALKAQYRVTAVPGADVFEANYVGQARTIPPGMQVTETTSFFAGAKVVPLLRTYEKQLGVFRFDYAVDWGRLHFITRPMFLLLDWLYQRLANFGLAILALTVIVKLATFPLAQKSYESITKMKKLQPQIEELKAKHGSDPPRMQQETMALYQREKINPLMGCLPILVQIPVFYALYKSLTVTIEMRHAPFFGWIHDLSSRDPTTIWNLFGAIPWDPATAPLIGGLLDQTLHVGAWALLYGFTMWLTQAMNPPAPDPVQQRIFSLLPIIFTFTLANFAVGLIIYWTWNNVLSIFQQYFMMHKYKVDNPIDGLIRRLSGKPKAAG